LPPNSHRERDGSYKILNNVGHRRSGMKRIELAPGYAAAAHRLGRLIRFFRIRLMPIPNAMTRPVALFLALATTSAWAVDVTRVRDPKGRVVAVRVSDAALVHTTQLLPQDVQPEGADEGEQVRQVLTRLTEFLSRFSADRGDVVKLNISVGNAAVRTLAVQQLERWFGSEAPAVAFVASPLPGSTAAIGLDAIIAIDPEKNSRRAIERLAARDNDRASMGQQADFGILPVGDVIYVSGQAESGPLREATRETMAGLLKTIEHLGLSKDDIVQIKCFVKPLSDVEIANSEIAQALGGEMTPPVVHVEWTSASRAIEIELIAAAVATESSDTVSYVTPPWMKSSPVFSRVARIHGTERIYVAGLYPQAAGDGTAQVESMFSQLSDVLEKSGGDLRHLAKATYYVSEADASAKLNQLRPTYYDPERPPAASKAAVQSVGADGYGITLDMIAAPTVRSSGTGAPSIRMIRDVAYLGDDHRATAMDLYLPEGPAERPRPAVLIVHGGGWHGGDKGAKREQNIGRTLAAAGYVCASINYALSVKSDHLGERLRSVWPSNLNDCKTAVRYLRAHAEQYDIDADHIGAIGGSAGGHLVAMLATTDAEDGLDGQGLYDDQSSRIQAVVPMYGVHDVVRQAQTKQNRMSEADESICRAASPITYITADDPPALILHGTRDALVPVEQSQILHDRLQAANIQSRLVIIPGAPHSFHLQPRERDLRELVIEFFDQHLKGAN
jgi:acetyl esterase/lipase